MNAPRIISFMPLCSVLLMALRRIDVEALRHGCSLVVVKGLISSCFTR
jgi:hypothetical protein